jgi:hypothetical protein
MASADPTKGLLDFNGPEEKEAIASVFNSALQVRY